MLKNVSKSLCYTQYPINVTPILHFIFNTSKKKSYLFTTKKTLSMIIPLESALVITEIVQLSEMVKGALKSVQRGKNHDLDESSKGYA